MYGKCHCHVSDVKSYNDAMDFFFSFFNDYAFMELQVKH